VASSTESLEALAHSEERNRLVAESLPGTIWSATADGRLDHIGDGPVAMDRAAQDLLGEMWIDVVHPDDRDRVSATWADSIRSGRAYDIEFRIRMVDGVHRWHLVRARPQRNLSGEIVRWIGINIDIDERVVASRRMESGLRALAETGATMFRSLDFEQTLQNVARAVARTFATYCVVDVIDAGGEVRGLGAYHRRHELSATLDRLIAVRNLAGDHPAIRALRNGTSTLVPVIVTEWKRWTLETAQIERDMADLAPRSLLCVPIRSPNDESVIGAMTCVLDARDPHEYGVADLRFAEEIAARAGMAFDHAFAYQRERRIAERMQAASLPKDLPVVDGVRLSADYRPGSGEATIGGDWYDAFQLKDGRVAITIGDVSGHGLEAAITMGKLRQSMRAAASLVPDPVGMLEVANRTILDEPERTYATALAAILDLKTRECLYASAGHPGPVLRLPDGAVEEHESTGVLLGFGVTISVRSASFAVPAGSTLAFFTDGLVEATRDMEEGVRRLRAALSSGFDGEKNPARALIERVLKSESASDDVAVVVVQT
jgi:PAS domain S-box-containing protein